MSTLQEKLAILLKEKGLHTLGHLAKTCEVSEKDVACNLPEGMCQMAELADTEAFSTLWAELTKWPLATFILTHAGTVLEIKGKLPAGKLGHGYFNLESGQPLCGHLNATAINAVGFMSMPFMGLESLSVQFFTTEGAVAFGVYVGRENRVLIAEAKESFMNLTVKYSEKK